MSVDWQDHVSQPTYSMKVTKRVLVPMRDGVHLSIDLFAPDGEGPFPALLSYSPYWNEGQYLPVPPSNPHPTAGLGNYAIEAGNSEYFATRGFVHVVANVRGTGESEGEYQLMGLVEQTDGYDLIEWLAAQPWCNGNVGMIGVSYFSWIQYLVASQAPPSLKAISPLEGANDYYRDVCYRGGILSHGFLGYWNTELSDRDTTSRSEREMSPAELKAQIEKVKAENGDIRHLYSVYQLLSAPKKNPVLFDALMHPTDSEWYHERSGYKHFDKIECAVFCGAPLDFWDLHLAGGFRAWREINHVPKKFLVYESFHLRPFAEHHDLLVRWFDHWLKGNDTGMMDEPPISVWVQGAREWRDEEDWPLARTEWTPFYLRSDSVLSTSMPASTEAADSFDNVSYVTLDAAIAGIPHLEYRSEPLEQDLEITGPIRLNLHASLSDSDGNWIVELRDVDADGASRIVSKGWLKSSFRAIDEEKSTPYRPEHPFDVEIPVVPGEVNLYAIQIHDTSNVFLAGHRIELIVKSIDHSLEGGWNTIFHHLPSARTVTHTVHHNSEHASHLLLPVIARE